MGRPRENDRQDLQAQTIGWSTPGARLGDGRGAQAKRWDDPKRHGGRNLDDQVAALWPTAGANDWKGTAAPGQRRGQLDEAAEQNWTTPTAGDCTGMMGGGMVRSLRRDCRSFPHDPETPPDGEPSSKPTRLLNPLFVEWLVGWPSGLTDSGCAATEWSHWQRRMRFALSLLT